MTPAPAPETRRPKLLIVLFVIYLVLLAWIVLWKLAIPSINSGAFLPHPVKLIPFVASGDAGASNPLEVIANIALFIPFGVYLRLLASGWRIWMLVALFVGSSLVFETTQLLLSVGSFDVTDVIDNTAGGVVGLVILMLIRRDLGARVVPVMTRVAVVFTVVAVLASTAYIASPIRYEDRQDVIVHRGPSNSP